MTTMNNASTESEMARAQGELAWAQTEATPAELRRYLQELRDELSAIPGSHQAKADVPPQSEDAESQEALLTRVSMLYEALGLAYTAASGKRHHTYDCPISRAPAFRPGPCNNCESHGD